ncbi:MAG: DUF2924 domain-containing protein [Rickettsiales bacterium]|jgi:hypothetical protein|nr:DUF2924 domain-containing protein [Rickettsiales bacterium]
MKKKIYLPKTLDELQKMSFTAKSALWARYVPHPFKRQIRALWHYVRCENMNLKIEPKYMTKIRKYMKNPEECASRVYHNKYNLTPGAEIIKTFRGLEFRITVANNGDFLYDGRTYKSLSAIAKEISGIKVSGPDFFGLSNKNQRIINAKN